MAHKNTKDLTGQTFGRLTVLYATDKRICGRVVWHCRCSCKDATEVDVSSKELLNGDTKSCGCLRKEITVKKNFVHGNSKDRFYRIWKQMKARCNGSNIYYGGRGIKVCDRWLDFENFKEDMYDSYLEHIKKFGEKDTTIDRINVNGNYEPSNCKWATLSQQARNTRCLSIEYNGITHTLHDWQGICGIDMNTLRDRYNKGLPLDDVFYPYKLCLKGTEFTYHGVTKPLVYWAKEYGISVATLRGRINRGWSLDRLFCKPKNNA